MTLTKKFLSLGCAGLLSVATAAYADTIIGSPTVYELTDAPCGQTNCGTGNFGSISLQEWYNGSVDYTQVTVTLTGSNFAASSGDALEFNVDKTNSLSNFTTGFAAGPSPDTAPPFTSGNASHAPVFGESVQCTSCSGGTGPTSLVFDVFASTGNLLPSDFTDVGTGGQVITYNSNPVYFSADLNVNPGGGSTGNVAAFGPNTPTTVTPEPSSLMLLGTGILGVAGMMRRRLLS